MQQATTPRLGICVGEPAGIGPDLLIESCRHPFPASLVAFTDPTLIEQRARQLGARVTVRTIADPRAAPPHQPGQILVAPVPIPTPVEAGRPDPRNARAVLAAIAAAVDHCQSGGLDAMVTGPVQKSTINDAGIRFTGHTEYLGELCGAEPVMMLADASLRVVLVTTHLPLADVSAAITRTHVERVLRIALADLRQRFGIAAPRLLVCGLNPHAGEGGHLGREELEIIGPAIDVLRAAGEDITGPVPGDTAFLPTLLAGVDAVVTMFHDQGLPVLKARGFGSIVNVTLGLPIIRTSVDHGTALDLAGSGRADASSFRAALALALRLAHPVTP